MPTEGEAPTLIGNPGTLSFGGKGGSLRIPRQDGGESHASFLFADNVVSFRQQIPDTSHSIQRYAAVNPEHFGIALGLTVDSLRQATDANSHLDPSHILDRHMVDSFTGETVCLEVVRNPDTGEFTDYGSDQIDRPDPDWRYTINIEYQTAMGARKLIMLPRSDFEGKRSRNASITSLNRDLEEKDLPAIAELGKSPAYLVPKTTRDDTAETLGGFIWPHKDSRGITFLPHNDTSHDSQA